MQNKIGADIIMALDDVVKTTTTGPRVEEAMHRTLRWIDRCIAGLFLILSCRVWHAINISILRCSQVKLHNLAKDIYIDRSYTNWLLMVAVECSGLWDHHAFVCLIIAYCCESFS